VCVSDGVRCGACCSWSWVLLSTGGPGLLSLLGAELGYWTALEAEVHIDVTTLPNTLALLPGWLAGWLAVCLSACLSVCLSLSLCLCVSVSVSLSLSVLHICYGADILVAAGLGWARAGRASGAPAAADAAAHDRARPASLEGASAALHAHLPPVDRWLLQAKLRPAKGQVSL
jgi:hypothetical protein